MRRARATRLEVRDLSTLSHRAEIPLDVPEILLRKADFGIGRSLAPSALTETLPRARTRKRSANDEQRSVLPPATNVAGNPNDRDIDKRQ
jgi:hypothetical protein